VRCVTSNTAFSSLSTPFHTRSPHGPTFGLQMIAVGLLGLPSVATGTQEALDEIRAALRHVRPGAPKAIVLGVNSIDAAPMRAPAMQARHLI
jgi:hypothetical protein